MTGPTRRLHFTLGPVQGFVAQARRTRDLWAGSFLLSWLSGQAMAALPEGSRIVVPAVDDDPLLRAIKSGGDGNDGPYIGTLVNRFIATVPEGGDGAPCADRVRQKWAALAERVWERFIAPSASLGHDVRAIWDRQINGFWETAWVVGSAEKGDADWLARRKAWRSHLPTVEGGDHCMIMGDFQEISGLCRSTDRGAQEAFWTSVRETVSGRQQNTLELGDRERLCAIALVKRLFPVLKREDLIDTIGWVPAGASGGIRTWPSTRYMAALPWLTQHVAAEGETATPLYNTPPLIAYATWARDITPYAYSPARANRLPALAAETAFSVGLDGGMWSADEVANPRSVRLRDEARRGELLGHLGDCLKTVSELYKVGPPSAYYALLIMDGDRLGALSRQGNEALAADALHRFSGRVADTVAAHNGITIYAGGDDVMAMLPLTMALQCACELRSQYLEAFQAVMGARGLETTGCTISGGLVFAEAGVPLRYALEAGHHLIDHLAKTTNGRDSLALGILKQGGKSLDWVSTWNSRGIEALLALPPRMSQEGAALYSSSLFYNLRTRYGKALFQSVDGALPDPTVLRAVVAAELCKSGAGDVPDETLSDLAGSLIDVCTERRRDPAVGQARPTFSLNGALLLRFLALEGAWPRPTLTAKPEPAA